MTQISTGGPYIAIEEHERRMEAMQQVIDHLHRRIVEIENQAKAENSVSQEISRMIEKIRADVAGIEARRNIRKEFVCAEEPRLKVDIVSNKLVPWSNEMAKFFEPWSKLGLDSKIPMEPGEGYEFLPHLAAPEEGDEFWHITDARWVRSEEANAKLGHHSKPGTEIGPYRRKIKQPTPPTAKLLWYSKDGRNFRVCQVTGEHVEMTAEREEFFKPWLDLGVLNRVPLVPGEGYEFMPHGAMREPDDGAEFWQMVNGGGKWVPSGNKGKIAAPDKHLGPYRRKTRPSKTVPSGTTQTVLADPKTFLVDSEQAYPLPKCHKCNSEPVWTTHNGLHRISCSTCMTFGTSPTKSIKQVVEWWTKMCEPVEKPRMRKVTLREYTRAGSTEHLWTTSDLMSESHYTGRTAVVEVPE